jgi:hypothetical protein
MQDKTNKKTLSNAIPLFLEIVMRYRVQKFSMYI